jgi:hypothetical protein
MSFFHDQKLFQFCVIWDLEINLILTQNVNWQECFCEQKNENVYDESKRKCQFAFLNEFTSETMRIPQIFKMNLKQLFVKCRRNINHKGEKLLHWPKNDIWRFNHNYRMSNCSYSIDGVPPMKLPLCGNYH